MNDTCVEIVSIGAKKEWNFAAVLKSQFEM